MRTPTARTAAAWIVVLLVAAGALAVTRYASRDPDSTLYSAMSARLSTLPLSSWIAPEWGEWGEAWRKSGLFREHPAGIFVLPSLLARAGYPREEAAFAVGALFSALAIWLVGLVVAPLVRPHEVAAAQWAALILPVSFVYRVRANQEYPVLVLVLVAIYSTERARRAWIWMAGVVGAACALALVKGVFVVFLPVLCGLWLWLTPPPHDADASTGVIVRRADAAAWTGVLAASVAVVVTAWAYEAAFSSATGDSFLSYYLHERIGGNAGFAAGQTFSIASRTSNVAWYTVRVLWFGMPGSFVLLWSASRGQYASRRDRQGVWFAILATAMYVGAFSLGANRADRFIFPTYFFVGVAGAVVASRRWKTVDAVARRLDSLPAYALPLGWLVLFLLTLGIARASNP
jgi:hypothetical protein